MFLQAKFLRIKFTGKFPTHLHLPCMDDWQATEMKSSNSPAESRRLLDFVPSIRPSFLSVVLVFVCGRLWVKNETTNERLIALESRVNLFPCVQSVSTENTDRISLSPTKGTARDLYKKVQTHVYGAPFVSKLFAKVLFNVVVTYPIKCSCDSINQPLLFV